MEMKNSPDSAKAINEDVGRQIIDAINALISQKANFDKKEISIPLTIT